MDFRFFLVIVSFCFHIVVGKRNMYYRSTYTTANVSRTPQNLQRPGPPPYSTPRTQARFINPFAMKKHSGSKAPAPSQNLWLAHSQRLFQFPAPITLLNPTYYRTIYRSFETCQSRECARWSNTRGELNITLRIQQISNFTSCTTSCAARSVFDATDYLRQELLKIITIAQDQLSRTRQYVAGTGDYDVIGSRTRIGDSCCLPKDKFVPWGRVMLAVNVSSAGSSTRMVSVEAYLDKCLDKKTAPEMYAEVFTFDCDERWTEYLQLLRSFNGEFVISPRAGLFPGQCNSAVAVNPLADFFPQDVCIARQCSFLNQKMSVTIPFIKPIQANAPYYEACPPDFLGDDENGQPKYIYYHRVLRPSLDYYTVLNGLPSLGVRLFSMEKEAADIIASRIGTNLMEFPPHCEYNQSLATTNGNFFSPAAPPSREAIEALALCPHNGYYEYCSMKQYEGYLQTQLYDDAACSVPDRQASSTNFPSYYHTLACLYQTLSLQVDCMKAVLRCYESEVIPTPTIFGLETSIQPSILCGFILCQKPSVYALFADEEAVEHAHIIRRLLESNLLLQPDAVCWSTLMFTLGGCLLGIVLTRWYRPPTASPESEDTREYYSLLL